MVDLIYDDIEVHVECQPRIQDKIYNATSVSCDIKPDDGFDVMQSVQIVPVLQEKTVNVKHNEVSTISPDFGYSGISKLSVQSSVYEEKRPYLNEVSFRMIWRVDNGSNYTETLSPVNFSNIERTSLVLLHEKVNGNYWFTSKTFVPEDPNVAVMGNNFFYFQSSPGYRTYFFMIFYSDPKLDRCYLVSDQWYTDDKRFIDFLEPLNYPTFDDVEFLGGFIMKTGGSTLNEIWFHVTDFPYATGINREQFMSFVFGEYYAQRHINTYTSFLLRCCNYEAFRTKFLELRNSN